MIKLLTNRCLSRQSLLVIVICSLLLTANAFADNEQGQHSTLLGAQAQSTRMNKLANLPFPGAGLVGLPAVLCANKSLL